jgi:cytochrome c-type biogenesis protein CcmE
MKAKTQRLWILTGSLACLMTAAGLILYAFQENITFFYTPSDLAAKHVPSNQLIRLGGMVVKDSVMREGIDLRFTVTDFNEETKVEFQGIAPDLFREGQGVVAEGYLLHPKLFKATSLLAKHDENYMPPELATMKADRK